MKYFSLGSSPSRCQLLGNRGACLFLCSSLVLCLKLQCTDGTELPWLVSSKDSNIFSCLCINITCTFSSSSSPAHPKVHKQTLSPLQTGALFFITKFTLKGGSLHQNTRLPCCSWFVARRPQKAIVLHARQLTENLL